MTCSACAPVHERKAEHKPLPSDGERPCVAVPYTTPPFRARTAGVSIRDSCRQHDQVRPSTLALLPVVTGHGELPASVGVIRADEEFGRHVFAVSRVGKVPAQLSARPVLSAAWGSLRTGFRAS
jgi:hypothetical protein